VRKKKDDYYPSKHITTLSQEHTDMSYNPVRNDTTIRRREEIKKQKEKQEKGSHKLMEIKYAGDLKSGSVNA